MEKASSSIQQHPFPPIFVAVPEAARRLGIGQTSAWLLIRDKKLPVVKIGRRTLVASSSLDEFADHLLFHHK